VSETVDVRIICATNRDPYVEVREGRFREDLFFRLHVLPLSVPPLRMRRSDVTEIAQHFLEQFASEEQKPFKKFSTDAEARLHGHDWPGNVRELQNVIRQAIVLHDGEEITAEMLDLTELSLNRQDGEEGPRMPDLNVSGMKEILSDMPKQTGSALELWQIEKQAIERTILACGGSIPKAARLLGVSPSTIYRKREAWADRAN